MIKPIGTRVLIKVQVEEELTKGGLIIPGGKKESNASGTVEALGTYKEFTVKVGDKVIFPKWSGDDYKVDGTDYKLIEESEIMGVVV